MTTHEDRTAAKLKGCNCIVKFLDGEEIYLNISTTVWTNDNVRDHWFKKAEKYMNDDNDISTRHFPLGEIAIRKETIKYIIPL